MSHIDVKLFQTLTSLNPTSDNSLPLLDQELDTHQGWPAGDDRHCLTRQDVLALMAALGSGRPLLITGEPGCGKSSMARAYASLLKFDFIASMIKPGSSHESLLWRIDHVERLAQAHTQQGMLTNVKQQEELECEREKAMKLSNFRSKGAVWQAFDNTARKGTVLLLDEADKAELTLVNGLLDVLDQGSFTGPENETISKKTDHPLLVVITSNGDRPMPPALIRRCAQHTLTLPQDKTALIDYLTSIGEAKFPDLQTEAVLNMAAKTIVEKRDPDSAVRPGISEYVDLLRVWQQVSVSQGRDKANDHLAELAGFFIKQVR